LMPPSQTAAPNVIICILQTWTIVAIG